MDVLELYSADDDCSRAISFVLSAAEGSLQSNFSSLNSMMMQLCRTAGCRDRLINFTATCRTVCS